MNMKDAPLVHFDGSIRTSTTTIIPNQVIEHIQRAACGEYSSKTGVSSKRPPEELAVATTLILHVVHYLRHSDIVCSRLLQAPS